MAEAVADGPGRACEAPERGARWLDNQRSNGPAHVSPAAGRTLSAAWDEQVQGHRRSRGTKRLEYAAVGPPVNLAARLCALAQSGQILTEQRTVGLIGDNGGAYRFEKLDPVELKGFTRAVTVFVVSE